MSRRRRRRADGGRTKWIGRIAIGLLVVGIVLAAGAWIWLRGWLHGEDFRRMLSREAGRAIGAEAEFGAFHWSGVRLETPSFAAVGEKRVAKVDARGLEVELGLSDVWRRKLRVDAARAKSLDIELDATAGGGRAEPAPVVPETAKTPKRSRWYDFLTPDQVVLGGIEVGASSLAITTKSGAVSLAGTSWKAAPEGRDGYRAEGAGGTLRLPWGEAPPLRLGRARLRYGDDTVFLTAADFRLHQRGRLDLSGEMPLKGGRYSFHGRVADLGCDEVLPGDWKKRLEGRLGGEVTVDATDDGPRARGRVELADGVLTALPLLDSLSAYANTTRFRRLALQECGAHFEWRDGDLSLSRIEFLSEGLIRVEGSLRVDREERLDGVFRLGLAPGILAHVPGAETRVFQPGEGGFLWTPLRIGGTLDKIEEDLTPRLIAAAGERMFELLPEEGEKVLKFTREVVGEDLAERAIGEGAAVIEQGREVLKEAEGVVREAKGLFDVLRGKDRSDDGEKERR